MTLNDLHKPHPASPVKYFYVCLLLAGTLVLHVTLFRPRTHAPLSMESEAVESVSTACDHDEDIIRHPVRTEEDVRDLLRRNVHMLVYVPKGDILLMTMAKAGTRTIWHAVYRGLTGSDWSVPKCGIIHDKASDCWNDLASELKDLPVSKQLHVLTSPTTFRVGIQREPFSRLVSAFKNKITCQFDKFHDARSGETRMHTNQIMHNLRKTAKLPPGPSCMNISEFADTIDTLRRNIGKPGYMKTRWDIDGHLRPQQFHFDEINYDLVLNTEDLSNEMLMRPLFERLPHPDYAKKDLHVSSSGDEKLVMDEAIASKFHLFAALSDFRDAKYIE